MESGAGKGQDCERGVQQCIWATEKGFKYFGCGEESGHIKRNCPKSGMRKVAVAEPKISFELDGLVQGSQEMCMLDTGSNMTLQLVPERIAEGLPRQGRIAYRAVGGDFQADRVRVALKLGQIDKCVQAAVVPNSYISCPLIGMNVGVDEMFAAIGMARETIKAEEQSKVQAVKTRAQVKKDREAEQKAAETRRAEKPRIRKPETEAEDTSTVEEDGEKLVAEVVSEVNSEETIGLVIPNVEKGASLADEYQGALERDESLKNGKSGVRS